VPLDAIIIATPSSMHAKMVNAALAKGLHVFCEKPFCLDTAEGAAVTSTANAKGLVNQVGYHYRFVGAFQEVKRLLDAKAPSAGHAHTGRGLWPGGAQAQRLVMAHATLARGRLPV
jgi:predicted dehydrogenase